MAQSRQQWFNATSLCMRMDGREDFESAWRLAVEADDWQVCNPCLASPSTSSNFLLQM